MPSSGNKKVAKNIEKIINLFPQAVSHWIWLIFHTSEFLCYMKLLIHYTHQYSKIILKSTCLRVYTENDTIFLQFFCFVTCVTLRPKKYIVYFALAGQRSNVVSQPVLHHRQKKAFDLRSVKAIGRMSIVAVTFACPNAQTVF